MFIATLSDRPNLGSGRLSSVDWCQQFFLKVSPHIVEENLHKEETA